MDTETKAKVIQKSIDNFFGRKWEMTGDILEAARMIGAGLAMIGAAGAGVGIGLSVQGALEGMARNPDTYGNLLTNMILGIAFSEAIAIYCLVIAFLMLFKVV